jgi:NTE family protein
MNSENKHKPTIDTLILSGGGPSGIAYFGILDCLFENGILKEDLEGIKEILTTSIGILTSFCLLIGLNMSVGKEIVFGYDIAKMLDLEALNINDILVDFGFFKTDGIVNIFKSILKNFKEVDDMTLKELFDISKIKLTVKVFNVTQKQVEYISYETDPELSIIKLAEMTTAIPFFFKPVKYNNYLYVDGGLRGHFPIEECKSKNYLGFFIKGGCAPSSIITDLFPILDFTYSLMINQDQVVYDIQNKKVNPRIIFIEVCHGLNFEMTKEEKEKIIQFGYTETEDHIIQHLVTDTT